MNHLEEADSDKPGALRRRDFLRLGSAGLLMPLLGDLAWAAPAAAATQQAAVQTLPMSVGYIDGSEAFPNLKWLPRKIRRPALRKAELEGEDDEGSAVVVPADGLFQADTSLPGRPLRIRVHGLYPPVVPGEERRWQVPMAVDLEAVFPPADPTSSTPLRVYVWGLRQRPGWDPSPPNSFRFPLDWQVLPQFILRVWRKDGSHHVLRTRFTIDDETGRPKLRRGVYLFGLGTASWRSSARISDLARNTPAEMFSVMVSMEPEGEE